MLNFIELFGRLPPWACSSGILRVYSAWVAPSIKAVSVTIVILFIMTFVVHCLQVTTKFKKSKLSDFSCVYVMRVRHTRNIFLVGASV